MIFGCRQHQRVWRRAEQLVVRVQLHAGRAAADQAKVADRLVADTFEYEGRARIG